MSTAAVSHRIAIYLGRRAIDSRVIVDGLDITSAVVGLTIHAHVEGLSIVTLELSTAVELSGEAGELLKAIPEAGPA